MASSSRFRVVEHTIPCQSIREYPRAVQPDSPASALRLAVKQYIPVEAAAASTASGPDEVTIIAGHANGIPKECYEPLWEELLARLTNVRIKAIWFADCAHQGASGVLNEDILGDDPSWFDHSRDLLHMVNHFRDQIQLPIVGIAHSFACAQFVHLSIFHPRLFTSLILVEPMIQSEPPVQPGGRNPALWASTRPDLWPSAQDAEAYIRRNPFWRRWDPRCVERYIQFGLREVSPPRDAGSGSGSGATIAAEGGITLTTAKAQEAWTYLRNNYVDDDDAPKNAGETQSENHTPEGDYQSAAPWPSIAYEFLRYIQPRILYIFGGKSQINVAARRSEKLERTGIVLGGSGAPQNVRAEIIEKSSHMVPLERVAETAGVLAGWMDDQVRIFRGEGEGYDSSGGGVKSERKGGGTILGLSERWMRDVKKPLRGSRRRAKL